MPLQAARDAKGFAANTPIWAGQIVFGSLESYEIVDLHLLTPFVSGKRAPSNILFI